MMSSRNYFAYCLLAVMAAAIVIAGRVWRDKIWLADERFDFNSIANDPGFSKEDKAAHAEWVRSFGRNERAEYLHTYSLRQIAQDFPIRAGMTLAEMDDAVAANQRKLDACEFEQALAMYNLNSEHRSVLNGSGRVYYWVNFKSLLHCDVVIESNKVQGVWVMPGNKEWTTGIYYRISGSGSHK